MRALALALVLGAAAAAPAFAQADGRPAVTPEQVDAANAALRAAGLSTAAYKNLWCGAAFGIVTDMMTSQGNQDSADASAAARETLYRKAAAELIDTGMSESDFTSIAEHVHVIAVSQQKTDAEAASTADFTLDECTAATQQ